MQSDDTRLTDAEDALERIRHDAVLGPVMAKHGFQTAGQAIDCLMVDEGRYAAFCDELERTAAAEFAARTEAADGARLLADVMQREGLTTAAEITPSLFDEVPRRNDVALVAWWADADAAERLADADLGWYSAAELAQAEQVRESAKRLLRWADGDR